MQTKSTNKYPKASYCALYMRLSKEDDKGVESASIETQRKILQKFARDNDFLIYNEYVDDGWSGTNLDRPSFLQMQSDIEADKINVVLTKDLSRLGRNSGRVNTLIDEYFPKHRVRYISVSEGIDTSQRSVTNSIVTPVHNFVNELYAADISNKIHAAFDIKMKEGEYIGSFAPYGYRKDPRNKNHLLPDEPSAEIVIRIFEYAKEGYSPSQIAKVLNDEHVLTPSQYRYQVNPHLDMESFRGSLTWKSTNISKMLRNEIYLGHTLQGKTEKPSFKSKYTYAKPKEEWTKVENTHEPIIKQETWDIVRKKAVSRTQKREKGFVNIFSGLAKCSDCGKNMSSVGTRRKGARANLNCGGYKLGGTEKCSNHTIDYDVLYRAVLKALKEQIRLTDAEKKQLLSDMIKQAKNGQSSKSEDLEKNLITVNGKLEQLFDDKYSGNIDSEQFERLLERFKKEKSVYESKLNAINEVQIIKSDATEMKLRYEKFRNLIAEFDDLQELDSELLFKLIDRIDIHQGEYINKVKHQRIDIYFKFQCEPKTIAAP